MLRDVGRLISFRDVVYYVGDQLYRRSLRYTGLTAAVSLLGYLGNALPGVDTYNAKVALVLPLVVGSSMLLGGFLLKTIPSLLASRAMNVAEAQDLDLMEDYRKSHMAEHLDVLWERVFRFEWAVGSAVSRIRAHPVEAPPEICLGEKRDEERDRSNFSDPQPTTPPASSGQIRPVPFSAGRQQFLARARFALARWQSQPNQRYYLGIDLRFLEDWYNGAEFSRDDTKLVEQYEASAALESIRHELGFGRAEAMRDLPLKLYQKLWFRMITRAVAIYVGDDVASLNRRHGTDYFNAQALLWPGEERQAWVQQFPGAAAELCAQRQVILRAVFGDDAVTARHMLRRMLWPSCWLASKLRAGYDPEYVAGCLGCDVVSDLEAIGISPRRLAVYRDLARQVQVDQAALTAWLGRYRPELLTPEYAESLRAARVAVHVRRGRLRPFLQGDVNDRRAGETFVDRVLDVIDQAARARERYSARLVALRMHQELTRLHYRQYMRLLKRLTCDSPGT